MDLKEIEYAAYNQQKMPQNLTDMDKCLFIFLKCLYHDYKANGISQINAENTKQEYMNVYTIIRESQKINLEYINRWNRCEILLPEIEKSKCSDCQLCDKCKKIARILDGRADYTSLGKI
jgi:hypothetical protein